MTLFSPSSFEPRRLLVAAAHPDDELLGCGGTLARWTQDGQILGILILGEGITSRFPNREMAPAGEVQRLQGLAREVGELLGASYHVMTGLPDNRMDAVPLLDIVKSVEAAIDAFKPDVILTHHPGDLNVDHSLTFRATLTAARLLRRSPVRGIYAFETPSATEMAFNQISPPFQPNTFIELEAGHVEKKVSAMGIYESEMRPYPHPRSSEALRIFARNWGCKVGTIYAEAFEQVWAVQ